MKECFVSKKNPVTSPKRKATTGRRTSPARAHESLPQAQIDTRRRWIAEAAYYRAERRGFLPGRELEDWLEAEREMNDIDAATPAPAARKKPRSGAAATRRST
jgi:hypothetical protein